MSRFHNRATERNEDLSGPISSSREVVGDQRHTGRAGKEHPSQPPLITFPACKTSGIVERISQIRRAEKAILRARKHQPLQLSRELETGLIEICKHLLK